MSQAKEFLRSLKRWKHYRRELHEWRLRRFEPPAPQVVKWSVLERNAIPGATWVETGTYLGETTEFLAARCSMVYSIEPAIALHNTCKQRFHNRANVTLLNGTSETVLPDLLKAIKGKICFWLDGHASGGVTFQGVSSTPVMNELQDIELRLSNFSSIVVMIDDMRCFDPSIPAYADYPSRTRLVEWAERNGMNWHIEHDIFVARRE